MKKSVEKLSLNKITISNLDAVEMDQKKGGVGKAINTRHNCSPLNLKDLRKFTWTIIPF